MNQEYEIICNYIWNMAREIEITFNRDKRLMLKEELIEWLKNNGGCVLVKEDKKRLKTKDKIIRKYIAKWEIKFQTTEEYKYHNVHNVQIKLLTKYQPKWQKSISLRNIAAHWMIRKIIVRLI